MSTTFMKKAIDGSCVGCSPTLEGLQSESYQDLRRPNSGVAKLMAVANSQFQVSSANPLEGGKESFSERGAFLSPELLLLNFILELYSSLQS